MKREILFLLCVLSAIMSKAENYGNYIPFLVEGKSWVVTYVQDNTNSYKRTYTIKGDTIINNMKYKKLFEEDRGIYLYALREEGEKVYSIWRYNPKEEESLWYDFGVNEGDMIETERSRLYITGTDHIFINGIKSKRIHIYATYSEDHEKYNGNGVWVEGIGSDLGPIRPDSWGRNL